MLTYYEELFRPESLVPKFAANLTMLFTEHEFLDRFAQAASAGFEYVEYLFPYAYSQEELVERLARHKLTQALHNLPAGNWAKGERGIACLPDRIGEFQDGVGRAIEYARALNCTKLNCLAGIEPPGAKPDDLKRTFVDNIKFAAKELHAVGVELLIEPINTRDIPRFYLNRTQQALDMIDDAGVSNIFLQYDVYHMQIMEGDLVPTIRKHIGKIRHIQIADNPGRGEPGTGEINCEFVFKAIDEAGYFGTIGCEYKPTGPTVEGLSWLTAYRGRLNDTINPTGAIE